MKKSLLLIASAALACGASMAQSSLTFPAAYPNYVITQISPNGVYAVSSNGYTGELVIINRETGEILTFSDPEGRLIYETGFGCAVSNNGIVVGSTSAGSDDAAYCENGAWKQLPLRPEDEGICLSHGITPDGSRIIGQVGRQSFDFNNEDVLMQQPVIWMRNADNTGYDEYIELPYPKKDFFGETPQMVTGVCISADGHLGLGQIVSGSGFYIYPILYIEAEDGTWSYEIVHPELFYNPEVEIPEAPGEYPEDPSLRDYLTEEELAAYNEAVGKFEEYYNNRPEKIDFMTADEIEAYEAAMADYYADPENNSYPFLEDFMSEESMIAYDEAEQEFYANLPEYPSMIDYATEEEAAAYEAAMDEYRVLEQEWQDKYDAYNEAIDEATAGAPSFAFNTLSLSQNGRYMTMTDSFSDWFFGESNVNPYIFDLETGDYFATNSNGDMMACYIANDGTLLATTPSDVYTIRKAYVLTKPEGEYIALEEYVNGINESAYDWMSKNMVHDYLEFAYDEDMEEVVTLIEDAFCTGSPVATPDLKYIATWELAAWEPADDEVVDEENPTFFYSYIIPMEYDPNADGIVSAEAGVSVSVQRGGYIFVNGEAAKVDVFDVNGRLVFSSAAAPMISTGLADGFYLVRVATADGNAFVVKAAF